jgi:diguanylate cyclase (GGDEF)-like protein
MTMRRSLITAVAGVPRYRPLVNGLDDLSVIAGLCALLVALRYLTLPSDPDATLGLIALAVLALAVHAYPLVRSVHQSERAGALSMTASAPLLAVMILAGPAWAIVVAAAALALDGLVRFNRRLDYELWLRGTARTALAAALAGLTCLALRGTPENLSSVEFAVPALAGAEIVLTLSSWALSVPGHVVATGISYRQIVRESLSGSLPALAAEPVLAWVLAGAARVPTPAALLAASLPLIVLIVGVRIHTDVRTRLERAYGQLRIQATTDALTGLANRRLFEELLATRLEEATRYGRPLAVLLLDLDGFKRINDSYGHAAGDAVLIAVADALRRSLRRSDLPARLAGDEFVALLPETTGAQALVLAERVCREISLLNVQAGSTAIHPSASVGAASTDGSGSFDASGLLAAADGAAYRAKAAGKNAARLAMRPRVRRSPARERARVT